MKTVKLSKLQQAYFTALAAERQRVERDLMIAVGMALAGAGVDFIEGMSYNFDGKTLTYTLPPPPPPGVD